MPNNSFALLSSSPVIEVIALRICVHSSSNANFDHRTFSVATGHGISLKTPAVEAPRMIGISVREPSGIATGFVSKPSSLSKNTAKKLARGYSPFVRGVMPRSICFWSTSRTAVSTSLACSESPRPLEVGFRRVYGRMREPMCSAWKRGDML